MKILLCLFLWIATVAETAPIRARRNSVLSFPEYALAGTAGTTEKPKHATCTATKNPSSGHEKEQESADMSEAKSREGVGNIEPIDTFKDSRSHEVMNPSANQKGLSQRRAGWLNRGSTGLMGVSGGPAQDFSSRENPAFVDAEQSSREQINLNSQEGLNGYQVNANLSTNFQRKTAPRRLPGSNAMLTQGLSREVQDLDSVEEYNGRPAVTGIRGQTDIDETREMLSSETNPADLLGHSPSGSPAPVKSKTS